MKEKKTAEELMALSKPGMKKSVAALINFAGWACELNERMHLPIVKATALVILAAEKRGVEKQKLVEIMLKMRKRIKNIPPSYA